MHDCFFFFVGDTPRLIPLDQGTDVKQRVAYFRNLIDEVPANLLTVGSFFHPNLVDKPRIPFIGPVRRAMVGK